MLKNCFQKIIFWISTWIVLHADQTVAKMLLSDTFYMYLSSKVQCVACLLRSISSIYVRLGFYCPFVLQASNKLYCLFFILFFLLVCIFHRRRSCIERGEWTTMFFVCSKYSYFFMKERFALFKSGLCSFLNRKLKTGL